MKLLNLIIFLKNVEANVIDSCIEVIIGMPDIRSHRLVHRIPSYFDSTDPTYLVPPQGNSQASTPSTIALHGKKVDKTLTVHVELGKTSLYFRSRS